MTDPQTPQDPESNTSLSHLEIAEFMRHWQEAEESAQHSRQQLFAALSRGVRGPVSHISGMAGLLMDSELTSEQHECVQAVQAAASDLLRFLGQLLGETSPQPTVQNPYAELPQQGAAPDRVLVADDDPTSRTLAARMLERIGYPCDVVENGLEAVKAVQEQTYCAVLMDCQMPGMDGYQATRAIRQLTGKVCEIPVIALTANAMEGDDLACLVAGMDDYLAKPVNPKQLSLVLAKWALPEDRRKRA
jgi:CheY-like chemotaxis protein